MDWYEISDLCGGQIINDPQSGYIIILRSFQHPIQLSFATLKGFFELTGFPSRALNLKDPVWCSTLGVEVQDQLELVNPNFVFVKNRLVIFINPDVGMAFGLLALSLSYPLLKSYLFCLLSL